VRRTTLDEGRCADRARDGESCRNPHDVPVTGDERRVNRLASGGIRRPDGCQASPLVEDFSTGGGWHIQRFQVALEDA
jgi:hypothetical protein